MTQLARPQAMRVDEHHCTECDLCYLIAPVIADDPQHIPVNTATLEAMAQCPTGAIIWREETLCEDRKDVND